jgi:WD40 repeat protein
LGEEADGCEIDYEGRSGAVVIKRSSRDVNAPRDYYFQPAATPQHKSRHPEEQEIPAQSMAANPADDKAFLLTLKNSGNVLASGGSSSKCSKAKSAATAAAKKTQAKGAKNSTTPTTTSTTALPTMNEILKLKLTEAEIAKMTKNAITHMAFMPVNDRLVLAASDKRGELGLWNIDFNEQEHADALLTALEPTQKKQKKTISPSPAPGAVALDKKKPKKEEEEEEDDESNAFDGVLTFSGIHYEYVSGLKWAGSGSSPSLYSVAYDGSIRCLDIERGVFDLAWSDKEMEYSCFDITADGNTAYIGDKDGGMDVIDLRSKKKVYSIDVIHDKKVNTVHLDPAGGDSMVTSATDTRVRLWDLRKMSNKIKPVSTAQHLKTCQAAYLAPDGSQRVVSTSFDDTVRVWDGKKDLTPIVSIKHNNQTGRWILPMRAVWAPNSDAVVVGNMNHPVELFNAQSGKKEGQLYNQELTTAIAPRVCVHPTLPAVAAGTGSGRAYVYRS